MTRTELIACMAKDTGITKSKAADFLQALADIVAKEVQSGESVTITGFGTFSLKETAARQGHKPGTGETIEISAGRSVKFTPGKALKDALNEGEIDEPADEAEPKPAKAAEAKKFTPAAKEEPAKAESAEEKASGELPSTATRFSKNWWKTYWV